MNTQLLERSFPNKQTSLFPTYVCATSPPPNRKLCDVANHIELYGVRMIVITKHGKSIHIYIYIYIQLIPQESKCPIQCVCFSLNTNDDVASSTCHTCLMTLLPSHHLLLYVSDGAAAITSLTTMTCVDLVCHL